jgi:copper ion binding protein
MGTSGTMEHITLTAPDISCDHCEATVKEAVSSLSGVGSVRASADTQKVEVDFDPRRVSQAQIEATLAEAGYPIQK